MYRRRLYSRPTFSSLANVSAMIVFARSLVKMCTGANCFSLISGINK